MVSLSQLQKALICLVLTFSSICTAQELSTFRENNLYGYKRGKSIIIPAKFNYAADFHNNRAAVLLNKKWGYINEKGTLVIPAEMDRAENFQYGFARFYQNGKIGLMDTMGKQVVPAICDNANTWDGNRWELTSGTYRGGYLLESHLYIPPIYKYIDLNENFIVGETPKGKFDIYLRNPDSEIVVKDVDEKPIMTQYYNTIYCDISIGGKTVIMDESGKLISEKYNGISYVNINLDHKTGESSNYYDRVYLLQLNEDNENTVDEEGNEIPFTFHLFFDENYQFTDAIYSELSTSYERFDLKKNGQKAFMNKEGRLIVSRYYDEQVLGNFVFLYNEDQSVDVAKLQFSYALDLTQTDTVQKYHFKSVDILKMNYHPEYDSRNEEGDYIDFSEDLLTLVQVQSDSGEYALFHLERAMYLTPFSKVPLELLEYYDDDQVFVLYVGENGEKHYSINGKISERPFFHYDELNQYYVIVYPDNSREVVSLNDNYQVSIPADYDYLAGSKLTKSEEYYLMEETDPQFNKDISWFYFSFDFFALYKDVDNRTLYGFITSNGKIIEPQFESLEPLTDLEPQKRNKLIQTVKNGKYGFYNYGLDVHVENKYDQPLHEDRWSLGGEYFVTTDSSEFISVLGKSVQFMHSEYDLNNGKLIGLASADSESENPVMDTLIPPLFISIESLGSLYLVETKNHLFGLYSEYGDCLLEPIYTGIEESEAMELDRQYYVYSDGKKKGVLESKYWNKTGLKYDQITVIPLPYRLDDYAGYSSVLIAQNEGETEILREDLLPASMRFDFVIPFETYRKAFIIQSGNRLGIVYPIELNFTNYHDFSNEFDYIIDGFGYLKSNDSLKSFNLHSMTYEGSLDQPYFNFVNAKSELKLSDNGIELVNKKNKKLIWSTTSHYLKVSEDGTFTYFENGLLQTYNPITKKKTKKNYENN